MATPSAYPTWEKFQSVIFLESGIGSKPPSPGREGSIIEVKVGGDEEEGQEETEVQIIAHVEGIAYPQVHLFLDPLGGVRVVSAQV